MQRILLDDGILRVCSGMLLKSWRWALLACRQLPCPVLQLVQSKTSWQSAIWIASLPGICTLKWWSLSIAHQTMWSCRIMCRKWICHFHPFAAFGTAISSFTRMQHILARLWKGTYTAWILSTKGGQKEDTKKIRKRYNAHYYTVKKKIH